ncbi:hypothetical protein L596_020811 [Steinernema carpocapsae]|uniref:Uncharacterized protein n=1 Tax=Steinernema carpocapsae TaxID=34508 RepID=A0A4U5MUQ0_STECR|nr:hypothetical protein L596_020811 [Steinernema carpocapsae]
MYSLGYFPKFPEFTWVIYTENWPAVILDLEYLTPHDRITSFLIDRQPDVIINSGKVDDEDLRKDKNESARVSKNCVCALLVGGNTFHVNGYDGFKILKEKNLFRHYKKFSMECCIPGANKEAVQALRLDEVEHFHLTNWGETLSQEICSTAALQ